MTDIIEKNQEKIVKLYKCKTSEKARSGGSISKKQRYHSNKRFEVNEDLLCKSGFL